MPRVEKPLDDRTFFILYALSKSACGLCIPFIYQLYDNISMLEILNEFDNLARQGIKIGCAYEPNSSLEVAEIEKIEARENELRSAIEDVNNIKSRSAVVLKLLPYVMRCHFSCFKVDIDGLLKVYFGQSTECRSLYYYNTEHHLKLYEKLVKELSGKMSPPYKIGLDRFLALTREDNKSKYAFSHFLYELEQQKKISIEELSFQQGNPLIIFTPLKRKQHQQKAAQDLGNELGNFKTLHLYDRGILNSVTDEIIKCERLEVAMLELFFRKKDRGCSYDELAAVLRICAGEVPKRVYKIRRKLSEIEMPKGKYLVEKVKNAKAYVLKFTGE